MRKDLLAAALGFLIGAAALVAGGEERDEELDEKLDRLQETIVRLRQQRPLAVDRLPPIGPQGLELALFPVFDLTSPRHDYLPPEHDSSAEPRFVGGATEEAWLPAGTVEEVMEFVRAAVMPGSWEQRGAQIAASGQTLFVVNSRAAIQAVDAFLDRELRENVHRCVTVEAEAVDLPNALHTRLAEGAGTGLSKEQEQLLATALSDGTATRAFGGRTTGFVGQRLTVWHGRQVAVVGDIAVEAARSDSSPDPIIDVVQAGGYLSVRPSVGERTDRITLDVDVRLDELERIDERKGADAGAVDLPRVRSVRSKTALTVPNRTWALLGGGTRIGDRTRVLLVRATYLPRGGGR